MNNKELPKRKNLRLHGYYYSSEGCYFLTICTENRKNLLSKVVGGDEVISTTLSEIRLTLNIIGITLNTMH